MSRRITLSDDECDLALRALQFLAERCGNMISANAPVEAFTLKWTRDSLTALADRFTAPAEEE